MIGSVRQTVDTQRATLAHHEQSTRHALDLAYAASLAQLQPRLQAFYRSVSTAQQDDEHEPQSWLNQHSAEIAALLAVILASMNHYSQIAQGQTLAMQRLGLQLGQRSATALLQVAIGDDTFSAPAQHALIDLVGKTQAGTPLSSLFDGFGNEAAANVKTVLNAAVLTESDTSTLSAQVEQALQQERNRAVTIAGDQLNDTFQNASQATFQANDVETWIWNCSLTPHSCAMCVSMHGTIHPMSESLDSHLGCQCQQIPNIGNVDIQDGSEWFDAQDASVQQDIIGTKSGYELYKSGKVKLSAFVGTSNDPVWGKSRYQRSVKQVMKAGK